MPNIEWKNRCQGKNTVDDKTGRRPWSNGKIPKKHNGNILDLIIT
jgi:hypothetical protein